MESFGNMKEHSKDRVSLLGISKNQQVVMEDGNKQHEQL